MHPYHIQEALVGISIQLPQPETIRNLVMRSVIGELSSEYVGHLVAAHGDTCEVGHFGECSEEGRLTL